MAQQDTTAYLSSEERDLLLAAATEFTSSVCLLFSQHPDALESLRRKGYVNKYGSKEVLTARAFKIAKKEAPNLIINYEAYGYTLEKEGKVEEAKLIYWKAINEGFDGSHPYERLRIIYAKNNDWQGAIKACEGYIDLNATYLGYEIKRKRMQGWITKYMRRVTKSTDCISVDSVLEKYLKEVSLNAKPRYKKPISSQNQDTDFPEWAKKGLRNSGLKIPELVEYYSPSDDDSLNKDHINFYNIWLKNWRRDVPIDLAGNHGYLLKYSFGIIMDTDFSKVSDIIRLRYQLRLLQYVYRHENFPRFPNLFFYLSMWIFDTYLLTKDYLNAIEYLQSKFEIIVNANSPSRSSSIDILLSLKYKAGLPLSGNEFLALSKANRKHKKIFKENIELVIDYLEEKVRKCEDKYMFDLLSVLTERYALRESQKYTPFLGVPGFWPNIDIDFYNYSELAEFNTVMEEWVKEVEDILREVKGLPKIGKGWLNETILYNAVCKYFGELGYETVHHAHPPFLGRQELDIYIPSLGIGFEYQGKQHYEAIDFFGGQEGLRKCQELDRKKGRLCKENGIILIEFRYDESLDERYILDKIIANLQSAESDVSNVSRRLNKLRISDELRS